MSFTEPTGREHITPVKIKSTSATERRAFRECRRAWLLGVVNRLDRNEGNVYFFLGTLFHLGLETFYRSRQSGNEHSIAVEEALDVYEAAYTKALADVRTQMGIAAQFGIVAFEEAGALGMEMLQNYFDREANEPLLDEIVAVEHRVNIPIIPPGKKRKIGVLSVQADVVGYKDGELSVADHKTASRVMPSAHLDIDDQLTAEVYSWWISSGEFPLRAIYNVAYKKTVGPPKVLKSGKLSKAKDQGTTFRLYRDEIARLGLDPVDYADILAHLQEREANGEDALFRRETVFRTFEQMAAFERDLYHEFMDMRRVAMHPEQAYPSPDAQRCGRCSFRIVCTTIQDDGDVEAIIKAGYVVAPPRR